MRVNETSEPIELASTSQQVATAANHNEDPSIMVRTDGLTKRYGDFLALSDCSLQVGSGQVFGLLGPNGAGKTTLVRLMLGFLQPTSGRCRIDGLDSRDQSVQVRQRLAYLPGDARLPRHLRGTSVIRLFAEMHPAGNLARSREIADQLDLDLRRRVAAMSTGMRQKLALAVVMGLDTPVLILDEPTANLDPTIRAAILDLVTEAGRAGRTVLFSSHVMGEIEETCEAVVFLRKGKLVHRLKMAELYQRHRITAVAPNGLSEVPATLRKNVRVQQHEAGRHDAKVKIETSGDLAAVLPWLHSLQLKQLRIEPLGLRAVYDAVHAGSDTAALEDEV